MLHRKRLFTWGSTCAALAALALPTVGNAQIGIKTTVTSVGSLFHYDYTLTNNTANEIAIFTLEGLPASSNAVLNLTAPTGFQASFDSGLGLLSFIGDTKFFSPGTTSPDFVFDSPFQPRTSTFTALDVTGTEIKGSATAPSAVPEPGAVSLLAGCLFAGMGLRRRILRHRRAKQRGSL